MLILIYNRYRTSFNFLRNSLNRYSQAKLEFYALQLQMVFTWLIHPRTNLWHLFSPWSHKYYICIQCCPI